MDFKLGGLSSLMRWCFIFSMIDLGMGGSNDCIDCDGIEESGITCKNAVKLALLFTQLSQQVATALHWLCIKALLDEDHMPYSLQVASLFQPAV